MNPVLPRTPGSYCLLLFLPRRTAVAVGRLGSLDFRRGYYLYLGSAFGAGGVRARVQRHLVKAKKQHWHVDYLRAQSRLKAVWMAGGNNTMEHRWAQELMNNPVDCDPIHQFGCSDCTCLTHLFYFKKYPDTNILSQGEPIAQVKIFASEHKERQRDDK